MKTYKGLRDLLAALGLSLLWTQPAEAAPKLAVAALGLQITQLQEVAGIL